MRYENDNLGYSFELPDTWRHDKLLGRVLLTGRVVAGALAFVGPEGRLIQIKTAETILPRFLDPRAREEFLAEPGAVVRRATLGDETNVVILERAADSEISAVHGGLHYIIGHANDPITRDAVSHLCRSFVFPPSERAAAALNRSAQRAAESKKMDEIRQFMDDAAEGRHGSVAAALERGVDVNARNPAGGTALMIAAKRGHLETVRVLLEAGADPNLSLREVTYRALHTAAQEGHNQIVAQLLKYGADINATTQYGETPLISAAFYGRYSTVVLLLEHGADLRLRDIAAKLISRRITRRGGFSLVEPPPREDGHGRRRAGDSRSRNTLISLPVSPVCRN